ncbi:unnamed protein product (macronuclear) [Paramecium tetraurelia]|uniref:Uncharacterized protein n=1 Tax=Paramecium tetraurelia TaxID=5888 RepID=A0CPH2_PARTE|nr:uncharacterized protein GSPATT00009081001 [Paramecium tetraurelia]CAK72689.1 unnamed protein product [Paramecium tetraurelia]|eukprot:XP_001440086.1 hypothetical protein (macronuclear) [Paramecium tetraurelia strain d4-2]
MSMKKQFTGGKTSRSNSKQSTSNPMSVRKRFSSLCSPSNNQNQTPCVFCQKFKNCKEESYAPLLNKALFAKYSSSQNYYYSKDINDIIEEESTPAVVFYRDLESMIEEEEYLKRSYVKKEAQQKVKALQEYYKYHKDIPRLFMQNVYLTINKFHEKKRRLEYANIKRKLNIPDEDQPLKKKEKKKQKHSDEDLTIGQLKYLLKDLKLDTNSYLQKKVDISSSVQLREFIQQVGQKYDCLGQISGLLSIDQSNSFLLRSQDLSTITKNLKSTYMTNLKPKVNKSSLLQNLDSKTTHQVSCQGSYDKINMNRLQFNSGEVSSLKAENSIKAGEQTKRSNQEQSPLRSSQQSQLMQKVYSQIEGFANFVQQQQTMQKQQKANNCQKSNSQRKVSGNFNATECQFRLPSRQNSTLKQSADLLSYQVNFLRTRVASQLQKQEDDNKSKQPLATDRVQRQSVYNTGEQTLQKTASKNIQKLPQKFTQYALSTLRGLQVKNSDQKKKSTLISNNNLQAPILNAQLMHYRTKSQDAIGNYKGSPPKQTQKHENSKDPLRITNNICVQGSTKKGGGVYNINQNNIVNIYIEDLKSSTKLKQGGGSQTARINSPLKSNPKFEVYHTQRSNLSPVSKKMA